MNARRPRKPVPAAGITRPLAYSVAVHLALVGMLAFGVAWKIHTPTNEPVDIVQAQFIDADRIAAERKREAQEKLRIAEAKRKAELQRREEARRRAEARQKAEAEKRRREAARKAAEERQRQAALEAKRKAAAAAARKKAAAEKQHQAEIAAKRKAAAAAAAKRKAAEAAKRKAEAERQAAEAEIRRQMAAEEQARQQAAAAEAAQRAVVGYTRAIAQQVERSWLRPPGLPAGLNCDVRVTLIPSGDVMGAQIVRSSGNGAFDRSVLDAVHKASPLPVPSDPAVFARMRVITFNFHPEN